MDNEYNYKWLISLVAAARADGSSELAAIYQDMANTVLAQWQAEKRDEAQRIQDAKDCLYDLQTSGLRTRKERHEAGMYVSNLYLAIRNAVYFS